MASLRRARLPHQRPGRRLCSARPRPGRRGARRWPLAPRRQVPAGPWAHLARRGWVQQEAARAARGRAVAAARAQPKVRALRSPPRPRRLVWALPACSSSQAAPVPPVAPPAEPPPPRAAPLPAASSARACARQGSQSSRCRGRRRLTSREWYACAADACAAQLARSAPARHDRGPLGSCDVTRVTRARHRANRLRCASADRPRALPCAAVLRAGPRQRRAQLGVQPGRPPGGALGWRVAQLRRTAAPFQLVGRLLPCARAFRCRPDTVAALTDPDTAPLGHHHSAGRAGPRVRSGRMAFIRGSAPRRPDGERGLPPASECMAITPRI